jgi:glucokinase
LPLKAESIATHSLIGDIGATNARFALLDAAGKIDAVRVFPCRDYAGLAEAVGVYLEDAKQQSNAPPRPKAAAIAVAGPVIGDHVAFINHPWSFSQTALKSRLDLDRLLIVNDFAAVAAGAPHLAASDLQWIGGATTASVYVPKAMLGTLGPGTGLGVSGTLPFGGRWVALSGEGGHVSLAPVTEREDRVVEVLRRRFGRASAERALSGPGLVNLYSVLSEIHGATPKPYLPSQVTEAAINGSDVYCREALEMFADMLGTVASDLALTLGAKGGIYIAGGVVPRLGPAFPARRFRERFEQKGRLFPYLADVPSFIIRHPFPAFIGLSALLRNTSSIAAPLD